MNFIKKITPIAEYGIGLFLGVFQKKIFENYLTVFCYHDVTNSPSDFCRENFLYVTPEVFDYQIGHIKKNFNIIHPDQLMENSLPPNPALVTFDDGYKSFFTNAIPILELHKTPVLIFLNMGPILGEISWPGLIVFLCEREPNFVKYLKSQIRLAENGRPLFLSCSQRIVENYLRKNKKEFKQVITDYVGNFADEKDLDKFSQNTYIFYGNHSYKHYVSSLLKDDEFLNDVEKNAKLLRKYPNYLEYFAFPFGQPKTTFTESQAQLVLNSGVKKVFFSSASTLNIFPSDSLLDRITLLSDDNSSSKINYRIFKPWVFLKHKNFVENNLFKKV